MTERAALIVATMDTKGKEVQYLTECIQESGLTVLTLDAGILGEPPFPASVPREEVALAGGMPFNQVRDSGDEAKAIAVMTSGAKAIAKRLYAEGTIGGIIGIGGAMGTIMGTGVMRSFPGGFPKVMISTMASSNTRPYVGTKDIMMLYSICDLSGVNRVTGKVLRNAANALAGMLRDKKGYVPNSAPVIAISTLGTTEICSQRIRAAFEGKGMEVLVFHTTGAGGQAMEEVIDEEPITAVIDLSLDEIGNNRFGGDYDAGPDRGSSALQKGVPTVIVPGNIDFLGGGPLKMAQLRFPGRRLHVHNAAITAVRTTQEEVNAIAGIIAMRCNEARGLVSCLVPAGGFSAWDLPGGPFYDPDAVNSFTRTLREALSPAVPLQVLPFNINTPEFADAVIETMEDLLAKTGPGQ
jgi:uncharacterized protein (UPF0261 family)